MCEQYYYGNERNRKVCISTLLNLDKEQHLGGNEPVNSGHQNSATFLYILKHFQSTTMTDIPFTLESENGSRINISKYIF